MQNQKVTLGHRALENQMLFSREALTCSEDAPVCCLSPHLHRQQRRPVSSLTAKAGYRLAYSSFTESYTAGGSVITIHRPEIEEDSFPGG